MSPRGFRLTACCVTALLVVLVPLAAAEGEYWKAPDVLTFPGGGSIAAGRVENLLDQDGRTLKLSDSGSATSRTGFYNLIVRPFYSAAPDEEWDAHPDTSACQDGVNEEWKCVDDLNDDGNSSYIDATTNDTMDKFVLGSFRTNGMERSADTMNPTWPRFNFNVRSNVSSGESLLVVQVFAVSAGDLDSDAGTLCRFIVLGNPGVTWQNHQYNFIPFAECVNPNRKYRVEVTLFCTTMPCDERMSLTQVFIEARFARGNSATFGVMVPPYSSNETVGNWLGQPVCNPLWECVNDFPYDHDGNTTYMIAQGVSCPNDGVGCAIELNMGDISQNVTAGVPGAIGLTVHMDVYATGNTPVKLNLSWVSDSIPFSVPCFLGEFDASWMTDVFNGQVYNWSTRPPVSYPVETHWESAVGDDTCISYVLDQSGHFVINVTELLSVGVFFTSVALSATLTDSPALLGADLSLGATGYYPIRAEWTCTARTGGPYYLGALNATGGTRWFNVTRDAGGNYPSGEMCAVAGATERYHAPMTAADIGADGRVHFRIADNSSDPSGSAWGNVTLDRLVAILTQDFAVSVGNLGWLVYLGFIVTGLLIAAFAYHRWREHGSGA